MFTMKAFRYVMQFCFSILSLVVIVPVFSIIYTGSVPFPGVLRDMLCGFIAANVVGLLVPIQPLADKFAQLFHAKIGSFVYILLTTFIYASFYVVFFSFLYTAFAIGFPPYYLSVVIKGIPLSFAVGYGISVAINPVALKLSLWICSKDNKSKDESLETEDTKKCARCLRRVNVGKNRCPHCGCTDFHNGTGAQGN